MDIILSPYKDPSTGLDWHEQTPQILTSLTEKLRSWEGETIQYRLRETNHGRSVDWLTITVSLLSFGGTAFFAIPAAHKKIRESLEEWRRIGKNLQRLVEWLAPSGEVASFPMEMLFFDAVENALNADQSDQLEFLSVQELPVPSEVACGFGNLKHHLFAFRSPERVVIVAIDSQRQILWVRTI